MKDLATDPARRALLIRGLAAALAGACAGRLTLASADAQTADSVRIEQFSAAGRSTGIVTVARVVKTDADWRQQLSAVAYEITRRAGTEPAFSGKYDRNHADGLYRCICCDTALYDSRTKFDSGTGWPSFWQPISALKSARRWIVRWAWCAMRFPASAATRISDTYSTTVPSPPDCATA